MKKIQIELTVDEYITIYFALRKAIHYTEFFDPAYSPYKNMDNRIDKFMKSYKDLLTKIAQLSTFPFIERLDKKDIPLNAKIFDDDDLDE